MPFGVKKKGKFEENIYMYEVLSTGESKSASNTSTIGCSVLIYSLRANYIVLSNLQSILK